MTCHVFVDKIKAHAHVFLKNILSYINLSKGQMGKIQHKFKKKNACPLKRRLRVNAILHLSKEIVRLNRF